MHTFRWLNHAGSCFPLAETVCAITMIVTCWYDFVLFSMNIERLKIGKRILHAARTLKLVYTSLFGFIAWYQFVGGCDDAPCREP